MKKMIAVLMVLTMTLSMLVGCGVSDGNQPVKPSKDFYDDDQYYGDGPLVLTELPEGMSGKEAASLILANQRLNAQLLQNSGNIFEDGAEVLTQLASMTSDALAVNTFASDVEKDEAPLSYTKYEAIDGSYVEIDGNEYRWGGFTEYSNSYDYFLNLTTNIRGSAEIGAQMIDDVKKFVRVVDKWVDVGGSHYYLHVEENSELLFFRQDGWVRGCIRTKTEDGFNRYEVFDLAENYSIRLEYIPGKLCEYSYVYGSVNHNFLAVNNKGFWEVVDVGVNEVGYNVSCMVIKDNICYDAFYNPDEEFRGVGMIKVVSADRETDILQFRSDYGTASVQLSLQAFSGYQSFVAEATPDQVGADSGFSNFHILYFDDRGTNVYATNGALEKIRLLLNDGRDLKMGDLFVDGKVEVGQLTVSYTGREPDETTGGDYGGGYVPQIDLFIRAETFEEQMAALNAFLAEVGLVCSRDMDYVQAGILQAYVELEQFTKYHEWNESPIYSEEDLAQGWKNNLAKHDAYRAMYEAVKNVEMIDFSDRGLIELHISFAEITGQAATRIFNEGFTVTVEDLALTVDDDMLFVVGESYVIRFALVQKGATGTFDLNHIDAEVNGSAIYADEERFTVSGSATVTLPILAEGEYTLVAYLATEDGIRSSEYREVVFTSLVSVTQNQGNLQASLLQNENGGIVMTVEKLQNIEVMLEPLANGEVYTRATMEEALAKEIYRYAFVPQGASLEVLLEDGSWEVVEQTSNESVESDESVELVKPVEEAPLSSGTYRLRYEIRNGAHVEEGSVYTVYTAETVY